MFSLILITLLIGAILAGLSRLLREAKAAASDRLGNSNSAHHTSRLQWKENQPEENASGAWLNAARVIWQRLQSGIAVTLILCRKLLRQNLLKRDQPMIQKTPIHDSLPRQSSIADPIDGTYIEPGEPIVRCECGTTYHLQSWQYLGEKLEGRCVNCKRINMASTPMAV